jgi:hypothetical protein
MFEFNDREKRCENIENQFEELRVKIEGLNIEKTEQAE